MGGKEQQVNPNTLRSIKVRQSFHFSRSNCAASQDITSLYKHDQWGIFRFNARKAAFLCSRLNMTLGVSSLQCIATSPGSSSSPALTKHLLRHHLDKAPRNLSRDYSVPQPPHIPPHSTQKVLTLPLSSSPPSRYPFLTPVPSRPPVTISIRSISSSQSYPTPRKWLWYRSGSPG